VDLLVYFLLLVFHPQKKVYIAYNALEQALELLILFLIKLR